MLGRGLVEPLDLHHVDNPPSHPELLALLTDELVAMKFDVKAFLREIALSQTYQRAIDLPEQQLSAADDRLAAEATAIEAELQKLTGLADESSKTVSQAHEELVASRAAAVAAAGEVTKLATAMAETKKAADAAQQALAQAQAALVTKQDVATAVTEAATQTEQAAQKLPQEKPLTDAAAKFRERATQLAAEVAAAAKAATEKTEPAKAASDKLAAEQKAIEDAGGKQHAAGTQVEGLGSEERRRAGKDSNRPRESKTGRPQAASDQITNCLSCRQGGARRRPNGACQGGYRTGRRQAEPGQARRRIAREKCCLGADAEAARGSDEGALRNAAAVCG